MVSINRIAYQLSGYLLLLERRDYSAIGSLISTGFMHFTRLRSNTARVGRFVIRFLDYTAFHYLFEEIFIHRVYDVELKSSSPNIIDVGSNIGLSVLFFKRKYPGAKIMAFEPDEESFKILKVNVDQNRLRNVEVHNVALSDREGTVPFYSERISTRGRNSLYKSRISDSIATTVQSMKLSDFLSDERVDLLKVDVEGSEANIFDDLERSGGLKSISNLVVEYHHNMIGTQHRLSHFLQVLETAGFVYSLRSSFVSAGEFQDVIVYARQGV